MSQLALYGHPFSSYTWKGLIPLYANETPFEFREVGPGHDDNNAFVQAASPQGKFPVLTDGRSTVFEATAIIEWLAVNRPGPSPLIPADPGAAQRERLYDRVYDNYIMSAMQETVNEYIVKAGEPVDPAVIEASHEKLLRAYDWLEAHGPRPGDGDGITLTDCAAAPSLFYADWVLQIPDTCPRLQAYRAHLLALPAVKRCVDDARPYRAWFPPGAPDRD